MRAVHSGRFQLMRKVISRCSSPARSFHVAERFPGLLPADANARTRAIMWMFVALTTVEPPIVDRNVVKYFEDGRSWQAERFDMVDARIRGRLTQLSARPAAANGSTATSAPAIF